MSGFYALIPVSMIYELSFRKEDINSGLESERERIEMKALNLEKVAHYIINEQ